MLIDTNVLLRLSSPQQPDYSITFEAVKLLQESSTPCILVPQVIYEFWTVATRPAAQNGLGVDCSRADRMLESWLQYFPLRFDPPELVGRWRDLVVTHQVHGKPAHDARLVAAMLCHGVSTCLTFNGRDFQRFSSITAIAPATLVANGVSLHSTKSDENQGGEQ